MSQYAIIQLLGKQHKVSVGDTLEVDRLPQKVKEKLEISDVLMVVDGEKIMIGQPLVDKAKVVLSIQEHIKGEKIRVAKYKAKSRYRRAKGHRQALSTLKVEKISA